MWKPSLLAFALVYLVPGYTQALEFKNLRSAYGSIGAVRADHKFQPGDFVCLVFDISGLKVHAKTMKVNYNIAYDFRDSRGSIMKKETPQEAFLGLGGDSVPGLILMQIPPKQAAGKYKIQISVLDKNSKVTKKQDFSLDVVPLDFAIIGVVAPALGVPGQQYMANLHFANMALDSKKKMPKVEVTMTVLDESGKSVTPAAKISYPRDLPMETDLEKANLIPQGYPVYLNRPGVFTIAIDAHDKIADKKVQLRIPLTVLDLSQLSKGATVGSN